MKECGIFQMKNPTTTDKLSSLVDEIIRLNDQVNGKQNPDQKGNNILAFLSMFNPFISSHMNWE